MSGTKKVKKCDFGGCEKPRAVKGFNKSGDRSYESNFCSTHKDKATINRFLSRVYTSMLNRVKGKGGAHNRGNWRGKSILPRNIFVTWAKNHPDFLSLYKQYFTGNFDRRLAPSINRMNSSKGYTLDNMEWMTQSQNSGLSGSVRKMNGQQKKVIYQVLGVKQ